MKKLIVSMVMCLGAIVLAGCTLRNTVNITGTGTLQQGSGNTNTGDVSTTGGVFLNSSGDITYSGGVENNKQEGFGISFYVDGNVQYSGQWHNGKAEGMGTLFYDNGQVAYVGQRHNGSPEGFGTWYYMNGAVAYQGQFGTGDPEGTGTLFDMSGNVLFSGMIKSHKLDVKSITNGNKFLSGFINGSFSGLINQNGVIHLHSLFYINKGKNNENNSGNMMSGTTQIETGDDLNEQTTIEGTGVFHGWIFRNNGNAGNNGNNGKQNGNNGNKNGK